MENDVDPEILKTTQNTLGKYVKRPPLSEKLLKKPPFRFLHDIITTVLKTTGFFEGLFEPDELISENVKDRDSKILFLTKVITVVGLTTGKPISVKPSKIVAGQEVEKTNLLLQAIAEAIDKKLSSQGAVQKYKESIKSTAVKANNVKEDKGESEKEKASKKVLTKKPIETKKIISKNSDKSPKTISEKSVTKPEKSILKIERVLIKTDKSSINKAKQKDNTNTTKDLKKRSLPKEKDVEKIKIVKDTNSIDLHNGTKNENAEIPIIDDEPNTKIQKAENIDTLVSLQEQFSEFSNKDKGVDHIEQLDTTEDNILNASLSSTDLMPINNPTLDESNSDENFETVQEADTASLNGNSHIISAVNEAEQESILKQVLKSQWSKESGYSIEHKKDKIEFSANQTNLKKIESEVKFSRPASVRPSSSRPGAPRPREKLDSIINEPESILVGKVNIITESTPNEEDEDSSIVIIDETSTNQRKLSSETLHLTSSEHGHLVQQILDSQKELTQASPKTEIEWHFGAQKAREATNLEIEQMGYNIQALSRAANPLGKLLDHIQEDVEIMRQELHQWTLTYEKTAKEVAKQKTLRKEPFLITSESDTSLTTQNKAEIIEESLLPLHTKLKQLDIDIDEKYGKIHDLKIAIQKKSSRIDKLLATGNVQ